jgi:rubrerythrin
MERPMNLGEAIKTAIKYETKVSETYGDAKDQATDPIGRKVFGVLANEEDGHIKYLQDRLDEWQETGKLSTVELETAIPSQQMISKGVKKLEEKLGKKTVASGVEVELLQRALKLEQETSKFYKEMVSELEDEGQKLFKRFVEIESGHLAIVQAEIDNVTGLGFWFDFQEFQLEAE